MASENITVGFLDTQPGPVAYRSRAAAIFNYIAELIVYGRRSNGTLTWPRIRASHGDASPISGRWPILHQNLERLKPGPQELAAPILLASVEEVLADRMLANHRYFEVLLRLSPVALRAAAFRDVKLGEKFGHRWLFERDSVSDWFRRNRITAGKCCNLTRCACPRTKLIEPAMPSLLAMPPGLRCFVLALIDELAEETRGLQQ